MNDSVTTPDEHLPDLMPCKQARDRWFSDMGKNAYYDALGKTIPAEKFGKKWFVLTRPLLRILDGERSSV